MNSNRVKNVTEKVQKSLIHARPIVVVELEKLLYTTFTRCTLQIKINLLIICIVFLFGKELLRFR